jgi:hypothetical protein
MRQADQPIYSHLIAMARLPSFYAVLVKHNIPHFQLIHFRQVSRSWVVVIMVDVENEVAEIIHFVPEDKRYTWVPYWDDGCRLAFGKVVKC